MSEAEDNLEVNSKKNKNRLIKRIRYSTENLVLLIITVFTLFLLFETFFREFPRFMPYPNKWNYIHHYEDLSRLFRGLPPRSSAIPKIVAIGDSFTRGAEVAPHKDWVSILNKNYGYKIFNLAVGGSSTVEQWVLLKEFVFTKSVKHVLLAIYRNDIDQNLPDLIRHEARGDEPFIRRAKEVSHSYYDSCPDEKWYDIFSTQKNLKKLNLPGCWYYKSYFLSSLFDTYRQLTLGEKFQSTIDLNASDLFFDHVSKRYISRNMDLSEFKNLETWLKNKTAGIASTIVILKRIRDNLNSKNISLEVIYLPSQEEIYYSDWAEEFNIKTTPNISAGAILEPHILELGLPYKNLTPYFSKIRKSKAPLFLPLDPHPSEQGHMMIAKQIKNYLQSRKIK